jgi:hypothetical protein
VSRWSWLGLSPPSTITGMSAALAISFRSAVSEAR